MLVGRLKVSSPVAKHSLDFKKKVINIIREIPYGRVTTYGTVATLAGLPRGARLVGGILHFNSAHHNLPWQRVVNRYGFISTSCQDHTKKEQKELLIQEGVEVSEDFMINLDHYGWFGKGAMANRQLEIK